MYPNVQDSIIYSSQDMEATCVRQQTNGQKNIWYIQIYKVEYYSDIKKELNFTTWSNMDRLGGCYAKWIKLGVERQMLYDIIYKWNLKKYNK